MQRRAKVGAVGASQSGVKAGPDGEYQLVGSTQGDVASAYAATGKLLALEEMVAGLNSANVALSDGTYTALSKMYATNRDMASLVATVNKFVSVTQNVPQGYVMLLQGLLRAGMWSKRSQPNLDLMMVLLENLEEFDRVFSNIKKNSWARSIIFYQLSLMRIKADSTLTIDAKTNQLAKILTDLHDHRIKPDTQFYAKLLDVYSTSPDRVLGLVKYLQEHKIIDSSIIQSFLRFVRNIDSPDYSPLILCTVPASQQADGFIAHTLADQRRPSHIQSRREI